MSESKVLAKVRKLRASRPQGGGRLRGIFHAWKDGNNELRLVGEFLETRTHFIAPAPKRGERGLCMATAFQGDDKLPQVINCLNWDIPTEEPKVGGCPICRLNALAHQVLQEECDADEKKIFEKLRRDCNARTLLKWNILDRDDPFVLSVDDGAETKVLGYKISSIGMEAWKDIEGVFEQMGFDITDVEEGIDVCVIKGHNGTRTSYSAQAVIDNTIRPPAAKMTPLTAEERALTLHDLKQICGKYVDGVRILDAMHDDYRQLLEANEEDEPEAAASAPEPKVEEAPAPEPKVEEAPAGAAVAAAAAAAAAEGDDDGLMSGTVPIRKVSRTPVTAGSEKN